MTTVAGGRKRARSAVWAAHLRQALRTALAAADVKPQDAGALIGKAANFGPRLLAGKSRLRLPDVFALLLALELKPDRFFRFAFPLGLQAEQALALLEERSKSPAWMPTVFGAEHQEERAVLVATIWDAQEWSTEVLRLVRMYLAERQISSEGAAERLGLTRGNWIRLLAGERVMTFEQLFRLLDASGIEPGHFFFELATPEHTAEARLLQRQRLMTFEPVYRAAMEDLAERLADEAARVAPGRDKP